MAVDTIERKITDSLERISSAIDVFMEERTDELGLNRTQGNVLLFLHHHPEQTGKTSQMAQEMRRTKATISDAVDTLVERGYIERSLSEEDRRVMNLELTEEGCEAAETLAGWPDVLERYMVDFSPEEKQTVLQFLMSLIEGSLKEGAIPTARMCLTCRFFNEEPEGTDSPYYCDLLEMPLDPETLRVDCDEQEPAVGTVDE